MSQLYRNYGDLLFFLFGVAVVLAIISAMIVRRIDGGHRGATLRFVCKIWLGLSVLALLTFTLMPTSEGRSTDFLPFHAVLVGNFSETVVLEVFSNVLLFAVPAFLLPLAVPTWSSAVRVGILALACSIGIELAQFSFSLGRVSDVTDILTNLAGAAIGWRLWRRAAKGGLETRAANGAVVRQAL